MQLVAMAVKADQFGFLPINREIVWDCGKVRPLINLSDRIREVMNVTNKDGFVYPPAVVSITASLKSNGAKVIPREEARWVEIPKTRRTALLHKLPSSHTLILDTEPIEADFRTGDGAFLMHFVGYVFGYRLQFEDWWHDGRVYMKGRRWVFVRKGVEKNLISQAYATWRTWPRPERVRFTNLLFMNSRSDSYEWDWERFLINYMVFDACYRVVAELEGWRRVRHEDRFCRLFEHFGIPARDEDVQDIVGLRNDLFHETLWDGGQPCSAGGTGFRQVDNLKRINERLIAGIAGCQTDYVRSPWWFIGQVSI